MKHPIWIIMLVLALVGQLAAQNPATPKYPGAIAADADLLVAKDRSRSPLTADISDSTLSVPVADGTMYVNYQVVTIDNEQMLVCKVDGNTLTICTGGRGFGGTTPASHLKGAFVEGRITASHHNPLAAEIKALETALGINLGNVALVKHEHVEADITNLSHQHPVVTVATLPSAAANTNKIYVVTDATAKDTCATGSGAVRVACISDGSTWTPASGGGGGSGDRLLIPEIAEPDTPAADYSVQYAFDWKGITVQRVKDSTGLVLQLVRDSVLVVRNVTGTQIDAGKVVYISGESGNVPTVALAQANTLGTMPALGATLENIADNAFGRVMVQGSMGLNTAAWAPGTRLWVSESSAGALTPTEPTLPNYSQRIATVLVQGSSGRVELDKESMAANLAAGPTGALAISGSGGQPVIDIVTAVLPQKSAANTWTGLNTFPADIGIRLTPGAAPGSPDEGRIWYLDSGDRVQVRRASDTASMVFPDTTDTLTNKTLDVEGAGNTLTTVHYNTWLAANCQGTAAALGFASRTTNAPTAACVTGTNTNYGVAQFADTETQRVQGRFPLPPDWTGDINFSLRWRSGATSGSAVWQIETACVADGETGDPAWNTAQAITDATKGTANQFNDASLGSALTVTGCAAGEEMFFRFLRDPAHASDDLGATAELLWIRFQLRRAQ